MTPAAADSVDAALARFAERWTRLETSKRKAKRLGTGPSDLRWLYRDIETYADDLASYYEANRGAVLEYVRSAGMADPDAYIENELVRLRRLALDARRAA